MGSIGIPGTPNATVRVSGCPPGSERVKSAVCAPCGNGRWSAGGDDFCHACPLHGTSCDDGVLKLQPGFYRPPARRGQVLDSSAQLYECPIPERCLVVAVNASSLGYSAAANGSATGSPSVAVVHVCSVGSTGPLCALCDLQAGYANVGGECQPCPSEPISKAIIGASVLLFICGIGYIVLRKPKEAAAQRAAAEESIALRIMLTHVQALAALRAFRASGLTLFRAVTAWTEALTPSVLSEGPSSCVLKPTFVSSFLSTLAAPVIASAIGMVILLAAAATGFRYSEVSRSRGLSTCAWAGVAARLRAVSKGSEAERVLILVLSLAYMSVVSACINVLDCSEPIDGVRYLRADFRVECEGGTYTLLAIIAGGAILAIGFGFPFLIFCRLRRATAAALAERKYVPWTFLFIGYRVPADSQAVGGPISSASRSSRRLDSQPAVGTLSPLHSPSAAIRTSTLKRAAGLSAVAAASLDGGTDDSDTVTMAVNPIAAWHRRNAPPLGATGSSKPASSPRSTSGRHGEVAAAGRSLSRRGPQAGATQSSRLRTASGVRSIMPTASRQLTPPLTQTPMPAPNFGLAPLTTTSLRAVSARLRAAAADSRRRACEACRPPLITPGSRAFWESTVLVRKMAIVLMARLLVQPLVQISVFTTLMVVFLAAHILWRPYRESRFALAEGASLLCLTVTASLAINAQPAAEGSPDTVVFINAVILAVNGGTLALLLWTWLRLCSPKYAAAGKRAATVVGKRISIASPGRRHRALGSLSSEPSPLAAQLSPDDAIIAAAAASSAAAAARTPSRLRERSPVAGAARSGISHRGTAAPSNRGLRLPSRRAELTSSSLRQTPVVPTRTHDADDGDGEAAEAHFTSRGVGDSPWANYGGDADTLEAAAAVAAAPLAQSALSYDNGWYEQTTAAMQPHYDFAAGGGSAKTVDSSANVPRGAGSPASGGARARLRLLAHAARFTVNPRALQAASQSPRQHAPATGQVWPESPAHAAASETPT